MQRHTQLGGASAKWVGVPMDLAVTLVFVAIGRHVHDHGISIRGLASTTWPFAVGVGVGWLVLVALRRGGTDLSDGAIVAAATVTVGMVLRVVSGQGTAVAFVLVAIGFLGSLMVAWRAAHRKLAPQPERGGSA